MVVHEARHEGPAQRAPPGVGVPFRLCGLGRGGGQLQVHPRLDRAGGALGLCGLLEKPVVLRVGTDDGGDGGLDALHHGLVVGRVQLVRGGERVDVEEHAVAEREARVVHLGEGEPAPESFVQRARRDLVLAEHDRTEMDVAAHLGRRVVEDLTGALVACRAAAHEHGVDLVHRGEHGVADALRRRLREELAILEPAGVRSVVHQLREADVGLQFR